MFSNETLSILILRYIKFTSLLNYASVNSSDEEKETKKKDLPV